MSSDEKIITINKKLQLRNRIEQFLDHLERNKWTYIVGVLGAVGWVANYRQVKGIDEFLDEEGIDRDKYWAPEAWEEKQALREAWQEAFDAEVKGSLQRLEMEA